MRKVEISIKWEGSLAQVENKKKGDYSDGNTAYEGVS